MSQTEILHYFEWEVAEWECQKIDKKSLDISVSLRFEKYSQNPTSYEPEFPWFHWKTFPYSQTVDVIVGGVSIPFNKKFLLVYTSYYKDKDVKTKLSFLSKPGEKTIKYFNKVCEECFDVKQTHFEMQHENPYTLSEAMEIQKILEILSMTDVNNHNQEI